VRSCGFTSWMSKHHLGEVVHCSSLSQRSNDVWGPVQLLLQVAGMSRGTRACSGLSWWFSTLQVVQVCMWAHLFGLNSCISCPRPSSRHCSNLTNKARWWIWVGMLTIGREHAEWHCFRHGPQTRKFAALGASPLAPATESRAEALYTPCNNMCLSQTQQDKRASAGHARQL